MKAIFLLALGPALGQDLSQFFPDFLPIYPNASTQVAYISSCSTTYDAARLNSNLGTDLK